MTVERFVPPPFDVTVRSEDGRVVVAPAGEVDIATAPALERELDALLARRPGAVVVDLRGVTFLDSTGVRVLLGATLKASRDSSHVSVILGPSPTRRALEVCGALPRLNLIDA
jgi:anti-sigma B factor antagonist